MIHLQIQKGGSELIPQNVKKTLNIPDLPDELIIGLWSLAVGHRSITVHLPDFKRMEAQEILAYVAIQVIGMRPHRPKLFK